MPIRVLIVSPSVPRFPGTGSPTRDYCLAREMAQEHEVTFLLPDYSEEGHVHTGSLEEFCEIRWFRPGLKDEWPLARRLLYSIDQRLPVERVRSRVRATPVMVQALEPLFTALRAELLQTDWSRFDLLQIQHAHLAPSVIGLDIPRPKVLDWHNVYSLIEERQLQNANSLSSRISSRQELRRTQRSERRIVRLFEKSVAVSDVDAAAILKLSSEANVTVVPNCVDSNYFHHSEFAAPETSTLVFTGSMDYWPNEEAVLYFCSHILPIVLSQLSDVHLYIVGQRPSTTVVALEERYPGIVFVTGEVDDVRPYLERATVSIAPLLNGGGTRLKILEAMSMRKPVVSTTVGAEGLASVDGRDILIADEPEQFAWAVLDLIGNGIMRDRLAAAGRKLVTERYDWRIAAERLDSAWHELVMAHG